MKRAILIATGTIGGLGAVLAVTPPQFTSTQSSPIALPGVGATTATQGAAATNSIPTATTAASNGATAKSTTKSSTATKSAASNSSPSQATQTPATTPAPATVTNGTFTGDAVDARYGMVQVKITVANGQITDAQAVQAPSGRNDRWTQMAVPILRQQTLQAQSANITGASGASFTSYGWYTSLVSALAKAGM